RQLTADRKKRPNGKRQRTEPAGSRRYKMAGGIGRGAREGGTGGHFWICGKERGYRRNRGCVARKGVSEERKWKMETGKWVRSRGTEGWRERERPREGKATGVARRGG